MFFDEILVAGIIDLDRMRSLNAIWLEIEPGKPVSFETFEPYTLRHLQVLAWEGEVEASGVRLRSYAGSQKPAGPHNKLPPALGQVRKAALASFCQNALDIYMDCPSRERAGWLGDSVFASRAEWHLCGDNPIERVFLQNFLLPRRFDGLDDGMVPMCYPAEVLNGEFIPTFAMFLVLQLDEARRGRRLPREWQPLIERRVRGLLRYFRRFENETGLLEKLEGRVFIEWSEAARFTQDVSFPSNMLYAAMLEASARLLQRPALAGKASRLRQTIQRLAWRGGRYVDNAVRRPSEKLEPTDNASEVCQYFALSFGQTSPRDCPERLRPQPPGEQDAPDHSEFHA